MVQWMQQLIGCAMSLVFTDNRQPVVLSIGDTMIEKFGSQFEHCSKLFDHARHNGSNDFHGHSFVCLLLSIPVQKGMVKQYLHIPLCYHMWTKKQSKLEIAAGLVRSAMECIGKEHSVILCCDSWYPKSNVLQLLEEFDNLTLICNVKSGTVLYDLPPARTGTRGRPKVHGDKLTLEKFELFEVQNSDYSVGYRRVFTRLFGKSQLWSL